MFVNACNYRSRVNFLHILIPGITEPAGMPNDADRAGNHRTPYFKEKLRYEDNASKSYKET